MPKKIIFLTDIDFDASPKVRASDSPEVIKQYAESYNTRKPMPPINLFWDSVAKRMYIADGYHRCAAMRALKRKAIDAIVESGTYVDALKFALLANAAHGLPRSQADKRQCVHQALIQWPTETDRSIGDMCSVDGKTVKLVRDEMIRDAKIVAHEVRVARDGRNVKASAVRNSAQEAGPSEQEPAVPKSEPAVPTPAPAVEKDALGYEIPKKVQKFWTRSEKAKELCSNLSSIIGVLKNSQREEDTVFAEVNFSDAIGSLERVYQNVKRTVPFAVCTSCQGHPETQSKGCRLCFGKGLISKFAWDTVVPIEIKQIRTAK